MQTKASIQSLSFFKTLNEQQIEHLSSISHIEKYAQGYMLHYEQTLSSRILFLTKGLAKAFKIDKYDNEIFLYYIYQNSLLSDISSLEDPQLLSYSNITIEADAEILSIDYPKFQELFLKHNLLNRELSIEIIQQSKQLQDIINREFIFDSISKVAMMLDSDLEMFNRLKRYDISLMLHIQPATLSRVLKRLKRENIIDIQKGKVIVYDPNKLQSIYKGLL